MGIRVTNILNLFVIFLIFETFNCQIIFPSDDDTIETPVRNTNSQSYGQCFTPNRRRGVCISIRDCQNLWQLVEKQATYQLSYPELIFLRNSQCGEQGGVLVCCEPSEVVPNTSPTTKPSTRPNTPTRKPKPTSNLLPTSSQCASIGDRIYGGKETQLGEYPWMALLEYTKSDGKKSHHCSGSLINKRYVLTAAHCIKGKIPIRYSLTGVRLGEWDKTTDPDCTQDLNNNKHCAASHIDVPVEKSIAHEDYDSESINQYNDIGLLRLSRDVEYTEWVRPICLPIEENLRNLTFLNHTLTISGWGRTETSKSSSKKLKANVNIVSLDTCNSKYKSFNITITDNQLCAGAVGGIDTCNGDSGGPLVANDGTPMPHYFIAGIVSYGPSPCALEDWAGVYTRTAKYIDWILDNITP